MEEIEDTEDGGAVIRFMNEEDAAQASAHFANIVDEVDPQTLHDVVQDLVTKIELDKRSREKRDKLYEEGLRRTGLGDDAPGGAQFTGATRVVHPLLVEACVDFSARVMKEIFPPSGPVRTRVFGKQERTKLDKAQRKADFMNWQATEKMVEFRAELEQLSTQLPLGGSQYLKIRWCPVRRRPMAEFVPVDDVYLPFAATNFYSAERRTHVQYVTKSEYHRRVEADIYRDVDLPSPDDPEFSLASRANDKIEGRRSTSYNEDGLRAVYEVSTHMDLGDGPQPYLLTIDASSEKALSLYRNWDEESREELDWMVEFSFIPWRGAYAIGLTHMIGGLSGAATGALRALLDSAHIQNAPTLLKLKGGPTGQTLNIQPTEVIEMEGGALVDDVRKLAMPLPFAGPSPTLYQLLGFLVETGKGVVRTSFDKLGETNPNAPVGTTLALIEQGMVVFSSIHTRLHDSMTRVFRIMHRINSAYMTEEDVGAYSGEIRPEDFDGPLDVVPVSDPNIFSEAQRFSQVTALQQRAAAMPQMYDARKIEEMFLRALKVPDDVLNPQPGQDDMDPVSENVAATMGKPVYVLPKQDHMAHIKLHMAFLQSPLFGSNPVIARTYMYPMVQHLRDHLLNFYMVSARRAVAQATGQFIESDSADEARVIAQVQRMIEEELGGFAQVLVQVDQMAQQYKPQPQVPPDNSLQVAQINAQVKTQEMQQRAQIDQQKLQIDQQKLQAEQARAMAEMQARQVDQQQRAASDEMQVQTDIYRQEQENARTMAQIEARERMNTADNQTAMTIAAAEIQTGENVAVSTGTGINP